ncbi:MAG: hypothetical protein HY579_00210 [Nitrospinae bacterium]|nr:hypothetical protein [Nitrospinota bacterium]
MNGRDREVARIQKAHKAVSVITLMNGGFKNWIDFLKPDVEDLSAVPRKNLKTDYSDVKKRLAGEIKTFYNKHFQNMSEDILAKLYDKIKELPWGLEIPIKEFEQRHSPINSRVLIGAPKHSTVVISLWGMQFKYPEDYLAKDLSEALRIAQETNNGLIKYKNLSQGETKDKKEEIASLQRTLEFASRACVLCCFSLLESYLNGIAWEFAEDNKSMNTLSNNNRKLIRIRAEPHLAIN